jgi:hypothetical protein
MRRRVNGQRNNDRTNGTVPPQPSLGIASSSITAASFGATQLPPPPALPSSPRHRPAPPTAPPAAAAQQGQSLQPPASRTLGRTAKAGAAGAAPTLLPHADLGRLPKTRPPAPAGTPLPRCPALPSLMSPHCQRRQRAPAMPAPGRTTAGAAQCTAGPGRRGTATGTWTPAGCVQGPHGRCVCVCVWGGGPSEQGARFT